MDGKAEMIYGTLYSEEVMSALGISRDEYLSLLGGGAGEKGLGLARAAGVLEAPLVWRALLDAAEGGNVTAIRLYFDIIGRDSGASTKSADGEIVRLREEIFGEG